MEMIVLVDDDGNAVGVQSKASGHSASTPRHLAFSCHILDANGRLLMTRRALGKVAWPGVWTNSVCGHPGPGEEIAEAVHRRARFELGVELDAVECVLPDFGYRARDASGIEENEFCPVYVARASAALHPNPDEVCEVAWVDPADLVVAVAAAPWAFSPWLVAHLPDIAPRLREISESATHG